MAEYGARSAVSEFPPARSPFYHSPRVSRRASYLAWRSRMLSWHTNLAPQSAHRGTPPPRPPVRNLKFTGLTHNFPVDPAV
jgi:hypothetical protein